LHYTSFYLFFVIKHLLSFCAFYISLCTSITFAQQIGFVTFDNLPANYQLYGRDPDNQANVVISGKILAPGFTDFSVLKYRNDTLVGYQKTALKYSGSEAPFSFQNKIKAELAEYSFDVYMYKSAGDSSVVAHREKVVAGDFYIIYGQSNAVAWEVDYTYRNEFCRTFGFQEWALSNSTGPRVGIFGIEFQRAISEKQKIPTCVINGATAGAPISQLATRNPDNHADYTNPYGALLNYAQQTHLLPYLKGIFFWQGEAEAASDNPYAWAPGFDKLIAQWKEDYPAVEKIYVFQLPLFGGGPYRDEIGIVREQQRTMNRKYPIVQPYAALGAPSWNGFHYGLEGYLQIGRELAQMADHFHYGNPEIVTSPSLQKAYYSTPANDEVTMVFEDYQKMIYPVDSTYSNIEGSQEASSVYSVKDFFYLNKQWQKLQSGRAEANRIIVKLKSVGNDSLIKYLPSNYHYAGLLTAPWVYLGPFLKNDKGFRAFAFHHNKIYPYKDFGTIKLEVKETDNVVLSWNKLAEATGYILTRYNQNNATLAPEITYLTKDQLQFIDVSAITGDTYIYQIRGLNENSESGMDKLTYTKTGIILAVPILTSESVVIYPNPSKDYVNIRSDQTKIDKIEVFSVSGKKFNSQTYNGDHAVKMDTKMLGSGLYILKIYSGDNSTTSKVLVER